MSHTTHVKRSRVSKNGDAVYYLPTVNGFVVFSHKMTPQGGWPAEIPIADAGFKTQAQPGPFPPGNDDEPLWVYPDIDPNAAVATKADTLKNRVSYTVTERDGKVTFDLTLFAGAPPDQLRIEL